jgi:hypothetical protein
MPSVRIESFASLVVSLPSLPSTRGKLKATHDKSQRPVVGGSKVRKGRRGPDEPPKTARRRARPEGLLASSSFLHSGSARRQMPSRCRESPCRAGNRRDTSNASNQRSCKRHGGPSYRTRGPPSGEEAERRNHGIAVGGRSRCVTKQLRLQKQPARAMDRSASIASARVVWRFIKLVADVDQPQ